MRVKLIPPDHRPPNETNAVELTWPPSRPSGFSAIVGQEDAIQRLRTMARLYLEASSAPAHFVLVGDQGMGKRTMAYAFAKEFRRNIAVVDARLLRTTGELMGILTNMAGDDVLLVRGLDSLRSGMSPPTNLRQFLESALVRFAVHFDVDQGTTPKRISVPLHYFTCIATVRTDSECPPELRNAFQLRIRLTPYSQSQLESIAERLACENGLQLEAGVSNLSAKASEGTPRRVEGFIHQFVATSMNVVTQEKAREVLSLFGFNAPAVTHGRSTTSLDELSGTAFEQLVTSLLNAMGFQAEMTQASGDGGIDVVATLNQAFVGGRYLIQCKRYAPDVLVGAPAVRDFYGALMADRRAIKGIFITTSDFTTQAQDFAAHLPMELINGDLLRTLLSQHGLLS
jgi:Holliday junction resolvasome RuvABC ATP-dependent DNA helicase subunit